MASITFTDYGNASSNAFLGDFGNREHILAGGAMLDSTASFGSAEGVYTIKVNDADVNAAETSITVDALPVALPSGTVLNFSGTLATLTAAAAAAATTIAVTALTADIANDAEATYDSTGDARLVPSGTLVGRTIAERASGADFGPAGDSDDEVFITIGDVDLEKTNEVDLVRHGTLIKTNFLPAYAAASSTVKTKLEAKYQLMLG